MDQLLRTYSTASDLDIFTSPSRAYSTEDGLFSTSPWAPEDESVGNEFFQIQDLRRALESRLQEASSSSGSARRSEMPKSVESDTENSDAWNDADDADGQDKGTPFDQDTLGQYDNDNAYAEGADLDLPLRSPSFQMRVFDPGSTDYESSNEYSAEAIENTVQEWSGKAQELPAISEEEPVAAEATGVFPTGVKRRSSDTGVAFPSTSSQRGLVIRRVSTMTDYQRLKGRHKSPKLVAFKASPAGPAVTAMSIEPAEARKVATIYEDSGPMTYQTQPSTRRTSQSIHSDLGISQMVWEEPSSSSDSDITVLTGSGIDYLVVGEIKGDDASSSPMERLKTKLKAWSWEREMSEASPDNRVRHITLLDTDERRQRRQSSDFLENPPGPPNTVRASGESSAINSDPQTPADEETYEEDEDEAVLELKAKSLPRPMQIQHSTSSAGSSGDYLGVPRRTTSLPTSPSVSEREESRFPHRDSVDISHARMDWDEIKDKRNQELIMNARDSFLINKHRLESKHPKSGTSVTPPGGPITWSRFGGLSPIIDASPPSATSIEEWKMKQMAGSLGKKKVEVIAEPEPLAEEYRATGAKRRNIEASRKKVEVAEPHTQHPGEHEDCPICEVHRPRWFEAEHREW